MDDRVASLLLGVVLGNDTLRYTGFRKREN
jgi:hypothetical protein